jgi:hypothetical protein
VVSCKDAKQAPCSLGLLATSQQYFSLTTNQPPTTSNQQPASSTLLSEQTSTSQPNRLKARVQFYLQVKKLKTIIKYQTFNTVLDTLIYAQRSTFVTYNYMSIASFKIPFSVELQPRSVHFVEVPSHFPFIHGNDGKYDS